MLGSGCHEGMSSCKEMLRVFRLCMSTTGAFVCAAGQSNRGQEAPNRGGTAMLGPDRNEAKRKCQEVDDCAGYMRLARRRALTCSFIRSFLKVLVT